MPERKSLVDESSNEKARPEDVKMVQAPPKYEERQPERETRWKDTRTEAGKLEEPLD